MSEFDYSIDDLRAAETAREATDGEAYEDWHDERIANLLDAELEHARLVNRIFDTGEAAA
jgi:hypothetical protein